MLLSTVFIHMVVEVRESLEKATTMGMFQMEIELPFAEILICMGGMLVFFTPVIIKNIFRILVDIFDRVSCS